MALRYIRSSNYRLFKTSAGRLYVPFVPATSSQTAEDFTPAMEMKAMA